MGDIIFLHDFFVCKGGSNMPKIEKQRMLEIENITKKLLINTGSEQSPSTDIVSLVKKAGFEVKPQKMDLETTGCLLVDDDDKKRIIMVNTIFKNPDNEDDVVFKKSRFITAHEYGHFILHKESGQPIYAHRDTCHRTEPIELEADYFARSILMPSDKFQLYYEIVNQFGNNDEDFTVSILSKLFKVTRKKIKMRMEDLLTLAQ